MATNKMESNKPQNKKLQTARKSEKLQEKLTKNELSDPEVISIDEIYDEISSSVEIQDFAGVLRNLEGVEIIQKTDVCGALARPKRSNRYKVFRLDGEQVLTGTEDAESFFEWRHVCCRPFVITFVDQEEKDVFTIRKCGTFCSREVEVLRHRVPHDPLIRKIPDILIRSGESEVGNRPKSIILAKDIAVKTRRRTQMGSSEVRSCQKVFSLTSFFSNI